jgi:hypothetical protein
MGLSPICSSRRTFTDYERLPGTRYSMNTVAVFRIKRAADVQICVRVLHNIPVVVPFLHFPLMSSSDSLNVEQQTWLTAYEGVVSSPFPDIATTRAPSLTPI